MPKLFDDLGIHFQYPDNWELDVEETLEGHNAVSVISPGGAFWTIMIHPRFLTPDGLADAALHALQAEYPDSDVMPASESVCGYALEGFDLNFFYLDLTSTALIRAFRAPDATYLIHCQAEDREFERFEQVFKAITASLFVGATKV